MAARHVPHEPGTTLDVVRIACPVTIRLATRDDLLDLDWFGLYAPERQRVEAHRRHGAGERLMIVAEAGGFAVGQVLVDLATKRRDRTAFLRSVRVMPPLRGHGVGTALLRVAERLLADLGYRAAELGVAKDNRAARRLYARLGYRVRGELRAELRVRPPWSTRDRRVEVAEWLMRKEW